MRDPFLRREIRRGGTAKSDISRMGEKSGERRIRTATNSEGRKEKEAASPRPSTVYSVQNRPQHNNRSRSVGRGRSLGQAQRTGESAAD